LIVVLARAPQGLSLFTVDGNAPGLTRRALKSMDPTRKFARLELNRVAARPLGTAGGAAAPFARTMVEAAVCLANEMVGGADSAGGCAGLCDDAHAVRQADLFVPVDEAQA